MAKYKMPDGSEAVGPIQDAVYYDVELRKKTINNLLTRENFSRKDEARKRYEVYNDGIRKWVEKTLRAETRANTVDEMMRRATSFNFCKKIINKLARVYKAKVTRKVLPPADVTKQTLVTVLAARFKAATDSFSQFVSGKPPDPKKKPTGPPEPPTDSPAVATSKQQTNQVQLLSRLLETDTTMKRVDQFVNLFRNILVYIRPVEDRYEEGKYKLKMEVLNPAQYDVLENEQDPTQADVIIIAQGYANSIQLQLTQDPSAFQGSRQPSEDVFSGQRPDPLHPGESSGNTTGVGNIVTELSFSDEAKKQMRFIWWSDKYHYVTDGNGEFIDDNGDFESNPDHLNPLGEMPIISLNKNQTERYWAPGGQDLVDGTITINVLMTDLNYIIFYQGMGLLWICGDGVPDTVNVGPKSVIVFKPTPGQASGIQPQVGFASSEPPIDGHLSNIEQQVAVLLSTNNLEPSGVSTKLSADTATSGIHELIKKADVTEAIEEQQDFYIPVEQGIYRKASLWVNQLSKDNLLNKDFIEIGKLDPTVKITVEYVAPEIMASETERLALIQQRLQIPLDTFVDAIKRDNPELTDEEAQVRKQELMADFKERQSFKSVVPLGSPMPTAPGKPGAGGGQPAPGDAPPLKDPGQKTENQEANMEQGSDED